ncbi:hypothetical protein DFQ13_115108 [Actinokineospora spheciospongiae]|nr:hypothetical protein DFQ13_115108 [Actinokineospora spheciospongiae]
MFDAAAGDERTSRSAGAESMGTTTPASTISATRSIASVFSAILIDRSSSRPMTTPAVTRPITPMWVDKAVAGVSAASRCAVPEKSGIP